MTIQDSASSCERKNIVMGEQTTPTKDEEKAHREFWLWEVPHHRAIAHLAGLAVMIVIAITLSSYKDTFFPEAIWLSWLIYFALIGIPGVLVEVVIERFLRKAA